MKYKSKEVFILIISASIIFIDMLDSSILNTAIPNLSILFKTTPLNLKSMLIIYLFGLSMSITASSHIMLRYGNKNTLIISILLLIISSFCCGLAPNLSILNCFRFLQGIGAGLSLPIARLIILQNFKKQEYFNQMNNIILLVTCGTLFGPLLGGIIIKYSTWQWLFWLNIPFGILAICICYFLLPNEPKSKPVAFDWSGFLLLNICLFFLVLSFSLVNEKQLFYQSILILLTLSGLFFWCYLIKYSKLKKPLIDIQLFKYPSFCLGFFGGMLSRICLGGIPFILPLLLQTLLKKDSVIAGLYIMPIALGVISAKLISKKIISNWSLEKILFINTIFISLFLAGFSHINFHSLNLLNFLIFTAFGIFQSFQYASANAIAYAKIPKSLYQSATSLMSLQQQLSTSLGISFSAFFLHIYSINHIFTLVSFQNTFLSLSFLACIIIIIIMKFN